MPHQNPEDYARIRARLDQPVPKVVPGRPRPPALPAPGPLKFRQVLNLPVEFTLFRVLIGWEVLRGELDRHPEVASGPIRTHFQQTDELVGKIRTWLGGGPFPLTREETETIDRRGWQAGREHLLGTSVGVFLQQLHMLLHHYRESWLEGVDPRRPREGQTFLTNLALAETELEMLWVRARLDSMQGLPPWNHPAFSDEHRLFARLVDAEWRERLALRDVEGPGGGLHL